MRPPALASVLVAGAVLGPVATAQPGVRRLSFQEAIDVSLAQNPDIAIAKATLDGAEAKAAGARAQRLPGLTVDSTDNLYREPYALPFGGMKFTLHDRFTTSTFVTIRQPLTGLAYLSELVGAAEHAASATREDYDKTRLDTAYHTAEDYLQVLEARASSDVAQRSVADIQSELERAIQLRQAETYTDIDVLRFRSAKAEADQQALRADTATKTTLAHLVVQLGLHDGTAIDITDDLPAEPPPLAMTLDQAIARALSARPELRAARDRLAAADQSRTAAREKYLPDISAVGTWAHLTGVQPFEPKDEEFVGLRISWDVWDWGGIHQGVKEAEAERTQAEIAAGAAVDGVRVDVREKWLDAKAAYDSIAAAKTQQQTADEALRLQKVRLDAGAATTTDVLDAETDAARARLQLAVARYDYYLALVALARSVGDLPKA